VERIGTGVRTIPWDAEAYAPVTVPIRDDGVTQYLLEPSPHERPVHKTQCPYWYDRRWLYELAVLAIKRRDGGDQTPNGAHGHCVARPITTDRRVVHVGDRDM
jgi:hypothetical protein